ncbi:MAG: aminoglycoside phosphotransferase family protein, partial [Actinomycetota bacterium]|nr:aminoglycoside phosphotransferase family protein [Actinomycetota bacterium]
HPGNSLWSRGKLSGIVDWTLAGRGFPAYDRAYLRLDLSLALGLDAGDDVATASAALGLPRDDPTWDLVVVTRAVGNVTDWTRTYVEIGLSITAAEVESRLATWFNRSLAQLH